MKNPRVIVLERGVTNIKEPNFCGTFCRTVCALVIKKP